MTKRQHGMGSVTLYRPGYWQIKYTTSTGERRSKAGFGSKKAAEAALAAAITDVVRGDYFDERKGRTPFGVIARRESEGREGRGQWLWSLPSDLQGGQESCKAAKKNVGPLAPSLAPLQKPAAQ